AKKLREHNISVIALDLTAIGQNLTPEQWYDGLLARVGSQLRLEDELEDFWNSHQHLGPCQRWFTAIREVALPKVGVQASACPPEHPTNDKLKLELQRLVIFVDEIDTVRSLPFNTDEFFAAIRECHNRRADDADLNRLTFCLLGVATPTDLVKEVLTSPFNIGRRIELNDFTRQEAAPLAAGLPAGKWESAKAGDAWPGPLDRILFW